MKGIIKRIVTDKGFGFIGEENGTQEFFFHRSAVKNAKFEDLHEGQKCEFEDSEGPKGPRAEEIYV